MLDGAQQIAVPAFVSTLAICIVFVPVLLLTGAARFLFTPLALRGITECWRAELRKNNIRVMLVNPSEVITDFAATAGIPQKPNESKLRGEEIAHAVKAILEMDDRGFTIETTVFATNPID